MSIQRHSNTASTTKVYELVVDKQAKRDISRKVLLCIEYPKLRNKCINPGGSTIGTTNFHRRNDQESTFRQLIEVGKVLKDKTSSAEPHLVNIKSDCIDWIG